MTKLELDPVVKEGMFAQVIAAHPEHFVKLSQEEIQVWKMSVSSLLDYMVIMLEDERKKTINSVLMVMDAVGCPPELRKTIVEFRDFKKT